MNDDFIAVAAADASGVSYLVAGQETCPDTGRRHQQCYVEFTLSVTLRRAKELLKTAAVHLDPRGGTAKQASDYCKKDGDFLTWGRLTEQGKRTDLDAVKAAVTDTGTMAAVCAVATSYQGLRGGELLLKYLSPRRSVPPRVQWFWGPTGTGKTRAAIEACWEAAYWMSSGTLQWWDGYDGEVAVILDDFRPEPGVPYARVLRLLDRYPVRVPVKGSSRELLATTIIVTSNFAPELVYDGRLGVGESIEPLLRRLHRVREFKAEPLAAWVAGH